MARLNEIKAVRVKSGYTQAQIAGIIGCSSSSYSAKENGKSEFDVVEAVKFCSACKIEDPAIKCFLFLS